MEATAAPFPSVGFKTSHRDCSQHETNCATRLVGLELEEELVQRSMLHAAGQAYHITCLTLAVFRQMLKRIVRTFLKKINCYIFIFASWFLHLFLLSLCISKPFFRGRMSTSLQLKLWKWPWVLRMANRGMQKNSPTAPLSKAARKCDLQILVV